VRWRKNAQDIPVTGNRRACSSPTTTADREGATILKQVGRRSGWPSRRAGGRRGEIPRTPPRSKRRDFRRFPGVGVGEAGRRSGDGISLGGIRRWPPSLPDRLSNQGAGGADGGNGLLNRTYATTRNTSPAGVSGQRLEPGKGRLPEPLPATKQRRRLSTASGAEQASSFRGG